MKYILFADDTNLFCADKNINQLVTFFKKIQKQATVYMLFGNLNAQFDIAINGISINRVCVAKFVGVLIDEKLKRSYRKC